MDNYTYSRSTGISTISVPVANKEASNQIAAQTKAYLDGGGQIEVLTPFQRNSPDIICQSANKTRVKTKSGDQCKELEKILTRNGFKNTKVTLNNTTKNFSYKAGKSKVKHLATGYKLAKKQAEKMRNFMI